MTESIPQTMIKASLILVGLIAVAVTMPPPAQSSSGLARSLDLIIYPDGSTHVTSEFEVDPQEPDFEVNLYGSVTDNFVALGGDGFLLESQIAGDTATIETLGASSVSVAYDIHDLVSKKGRIWSFVIDAPSDYSLSMPKNAVIVGMSNLPLSMEISEERSKLLLPEGQAQIDYIFGVPRADPTTPPTQTIRPEAGTEMTGSLIATAAAAATAASIIGAVMYLRKARHPPSAKPAVAKSEMLKSGAKTLDPQTIFKLRPDLREDDKEIVSFIYENGGRAKESDLRKKFLQPRTTMWRAVKRLERHGIIKIEKKDQQNLVILKDELEGEQ